MDMDERTAALKSEHMGKTYYFCSPGCKKAFDAEPHRYMGGPMEQGGTQAMLVTRTHRPLLPTGTPK